MKYKVRSGGGELEYASFEQLEEAARMGFVEPDDEFLREGETEWKKVSSQPRLLQGRRATSMFANPLVRWIALAIMIALFAAWAIHQGSTQDKPELWAAGLTAAFVSAGILFKVTSAAQRRR